MTKATLLIGWLALAVLHTLSASAEPNTPVNPSASPAASAESPPSSPLSMSSQPAPAAPASPLSQAPLRYEDGLLLISGHLPGGPTGDFVVDFGSTGTAVAKDYLPPEVIKALDDPNRPDYQKPSAAGGDVNGFLGRIIFDKLVFGNFAFDDVALDVLGDSLVFMGHHCAGILGVDLLHRADLVAFSYSGDDSSRLTIAQADEWNVAGGAVEFPFRAVGGHMFVQGAVNGVPVSFLFDTGARNNIITSGVAKAAALVPDQDDRYDFTGLDGNTIKGAPAPVDTLNLGASSFPLQTVMVADLPVLSTFDSNLPVGLIGNDFLESFDRIEVDFSRMTIRLWQAPPAPPADATAGAE